MKGKRTQGRMVKGYCRPAVSSTANDVLSAVASAMEAVPIPVAVVDRELQIRSFNRAFRGRLGLKRKGAMLGKRWGEVFPAGKEDIEEVIRMGSPHVIRVREGWPNDYGTALRDVHISALFARMQAAGACIAIDEGSSLERCEGELARQLAHHLRTPLAIMEMAIEMFGTASSKGDSARMKVARAIIKHNLDRHRLDIENILGHFRTSTGKRRRVSMATLLREVLRENRVVMDAMGVKCSMVIDGKVPFIPLVRSDMKRVFSVIIQDAVMSADGVTVSVRADKKKKNVIITVVGKAYARGRNGSGKHILPASGINLSSCRGMVESMGGRIEVRSRGVSVSLPVDSARKGA